VIRAALLSPVLSVAVGCIVTARALEVVGVITLGQDVTVVRNNE
jgi:hypothetical protein